MVMKEDYAETKGICCVINIIYNFLFPGILVIEKFGSIFMVFLC